MKPNFALTLSFEGIGLLHRAFPGWHLVGDVALDCADLNAELSELRQKAHLLDPSGLNAKLVLPNDQIKYLALNHFDEDSDDVEAAVRAALDGATPYDVGDLAFDWAQKDGALYIAAVARETLNEAEAFAVDHQFSPVCFVSIPETNQFVGEPFFGVTDWAVSTSITDAEIVRDTAPIRVIGASKLPDPEMQDDPEPDEQTEDNFDTADATLSSEEQPTLDTVEVEAPEPEPEPEPEQAIAPKEEQAPTTAFVSIRASRGDNGDVAPRLDGVVRDTSAARITLGSASDAPDEPDDAPAITGVSDATLPLEDDDAERAPPAFVADPQSRMDQPAAAEPDRRPAIPPAPEIEPAVEPEPEDRATAPIPVATPGAGPASAPPVEDKPSFFTRRSRQKKAKDIPTADIPEPADEKQRMTIFGAREPVGIGGKPRFLGLILTAVLLLFLIGVAAWASIFMDDGLARFFRSDDTPVVASLPSSEEAEAALSEEEQIELASLIPDEAVSVLDDPATEILSRVNPSDLSPDEAKARYAATGIWQLAPEPSASPQPTDLEDVYQTSLDAEPNFQDAIALPSPAAALTDGIMFTPASPPAPDTRFVFDLRGFVLASPDGALTPDGVMVFAGRPPVKMPAAIAQTDPQDQPQAAESEVQTAALRPRARPDDLAEQIERSGLNGRTRNELASLRPKLRPQSAQEAAEEARKKAEAEELAKQQAEDADKPDTDSAAVESAVADASRATLAFAGATPQAVKTSVKPRVKPGNFDTIVKRTKRNQADGDDAGSGAGQAVAVRASQRVSPKIPSKASVSKRATEKNALKFKRVNLIGVYGTPNTRRALVRMSNGRYKKVKVGDRLDGGKVNAIGDSDLRYTKGGRTVVLKMPRG